LRDLRGRLQGTWGWDTRIIRNISLVHATARYAHIVHVLRISSIHTWQFGVGQHRCGVVESTGRKNMTELRSLPRKGKQRGHIKLQIRTSGAMPRENAPQLVLQPPQSRRWTCAGFIWTCTAISAACVALKREIYLYGLQGFPCPDADCLRHPMERKKKGRNSPEESPCKISALASLCRHITTSN